MGYAGSGRKPPKGVMNWVAQPSPGQEPMQFEVGAGSRGGAGVWGGGGGVQQWRSTVCVSGGGVGEGVARRGTPHVRGPCVEPAACTQACCSRPQQGIQESWPGPIAGGLTHACVRPSTLLPSLLFNTSISPRGKTQARIYDTLFKSEDPSAHEDWLSDINPRSLEVLQGCLASPNLAAAKPGDTFQFERLGWVTRS